MKHAFVNPKSDGGDSTVTRPSDWNAEHIGSPYPLDRYTLDGTYGDHFTSASLSGIWTRRNFTSGAETRQLGIDATWMRIDVHSRANGDYYLQTAPAGNWTFAIKIIMRSCTAGFGVAVVDTNGTGAGMIPNYGPHTPWAPLLVNITTYSTYGGTYYEPTLNGSTSALNRNIFASDPLDIPEWVYLRKSGTNYYGAFSLDGEIWSPEAGPLSWAGTVDRIGFGLIPPGGSTSSESQVEIDWFNKIA